MAVINRIAAFEEDMAAWRRDLHRHPELAFEEHWTADFVAEKLAGFGIEVARGLAGTGVVGTLSTGDGPAVALRADMDALPLQEANDFPHRSQIDGRMHACGHDGHTTMLLGAARYLAETRRFQGTVHFVFQPAEENEGGARVMVDEGLFTRFPVSAVFGMHNWPGLPAGTFAVWPGPIMAAFDVFDLTVRGKGAHGGMPHLGIDPIVTAAEIVTALQTIVGRTVDPLDSAVVSVTRFVAGDSYNIIPESVALSGTVRSFRGEVQDAMEAAVRRIAAGVCAAHGATMTLTYERRYPATVNEPAATEAAARAAVDVAGDRALRREPTPSMGAEDFAFMLGAKPGCYVWLGNGPGDDGRVLHNPRYDFNDAILATGASYWARLVETTLV